MEYIMIEGIGLKVVDIGEFKQLFMKQGDEFIRTVFTFKEMEYCKKRPIQSLAARFAVKVAWAKASGFRESLNWIDVETINHISGKPYICLHGNALLWANSCKLKESSVSITHSKTVAMALVILQK
ncbi:MAG: holo-ACP synthase [Bacillota bacterium]|nr:holo-ACP synthase [Bacillota bacterium]